MGKWEDGKMGRWEEGKRSEENLTALNNDASSVIENPKSKIQNFL
jgi:hypothetical protein